MEGGKKAAPARKVTLITDATRESAAALQYTLSHAILDNDTLNLLYVEHNNSWKNTFSFFRKPGPTAQNAAASPMPDDIRTGGGSGVDLGFLEAMKEACQKVQPKIQLSTEVVEMDGKEKVNVIFSQCSELGIDLLIIGQRRSLSSAILGKQKRNRPLRATETVEYLIDKSKSTCVAVQKKGQNAGYLLNTKTLKDFWLLA